MIDLIAIRARDEDDYATAEVLRNIQWAGNTDPELTATINMVADRHALLAAYDALAAENAALKAQLAYAASTGDECAIEVESLRSRLLDAKEQVAALESREVCTVAHDNVETCGYCQRDELLAERALIVTRAENAERALVEAEQLLSACYSPVRRIAEGGSRTREDLDLAAETFAALKRYLKPVAIRSTPGTPGRSE